MSNESYKEGIIQIIPYILGRSGMSKSNPLAGRTLVKLTKKHTTRATFNEL